jgi:hypothetical protein
VINDHLAFNIKSNSSILMVGISYALIAPLMAMRKIW